MYVYSTEEKNAVSLTFQAIEAIIVFIPFSKTDKLTDRLTQWLADWQTGKQAQKLFIKS